MTRRRLWPLAAGLVAAVVATGLAVTVWTANAATTGFHGVNWADTRDNFVNDALVLGGLSTSDDYATTKAKADAILSGFQNNLSANTVRMPVNYPTVSGAYWASYTGAIDAAVGKGMNVILSYWEAANSKDGLVDNLTQFWSMWQTIVNKYQGTGNVYFEPMNEPHGYSDADWRNLAAQWLANYPGVPKGRVIISGSGYNTGLTGVGGDSRFNGTLISLHTYEFFNSSFTTEAQWHQLISSSVGSYASRVVITEWGAPMTDGHNYDAASSDKYVSFIRGVAAEARALHLGTVYWPGLRLNDGYRLQDLQGSGTALTLATTNTSGRDQLRYSWGLGDTGTPTYYRITGRNSGKVVDVAGQSTVDRGQIDIWTWNGGGNQKWWLQSAGGGYYSIMNQKSGKCLDVAGQSTADGANVIQFTCNGGANQQWQMTAVGSYFELVARHSGKCLDVVAFGKADGTAIDQYTCNGGTNQQWSRTAA